METIKVPTYGVGFSLVPAASATDIVTLTGAAGKVVDFTIVWEEE